MVSSFVCFNCVFLLILATSSCCGCRVLIWKIDAMPFQCLTSCLLHLLCPTLDKSRIGVDSLQGNVEGRFRGTPETHLFGTTSILLERCHQLQQQHCCRKMRCSVESWGSVMWFPSPSVSRSAIEGTWADRLAVRFTCVWKWTEQFLLALQKAVDSATFMIMAIGATQPKIQTNELSLSLSLCLWLNSVTCFVTLSADVLCACQHFYSVHYEVNVNCKM